MTDIKGLGGHTHTFVVGPGDSAASLAEQYLGSAARWREVLAASEAGRPGREQVLALPDDVSGASPRSWPVRQLHVLLGRRDPDAPLVPMLRVGEEITVFDIASSSGHGQ